MGRRTLNFLYPLIEFFVYIIDNQLLTVSFAMYATDIFSILNDVGFVGGWHIDFTVNRMRGDGRVGPLFGINPSKALHGVNLDLLDKAYTAEDLEMIKRHRRMIAGVGGRLQLSYKLFDPIIGERVTVHSMMNVKVDPYGLLKEAKGVLFRSPTSLHQPANNDASHEDAIRRLSDAAKVVDTLGYDSLKVMLQVATREIARDAAKKKSIL